MRWTMAATVLLVTSGFLAGCSEDKTAAVPPSRELIATPDTGVIRGVVVDASITPIAGVTVRLLDDASPLETTTDAEGFFGFEGLAPGDYFVKAEKPGYTSAQASTSVIANIPDPPMVRIQLEVDPGSLPYALGPFVFEGFMECSVRSVVVGVAVCYAVSNSLPGNASQDNTQVHYPLERKPTYAQSELHWEATQELGKSLAFRTSWGTCGLAFYCDYGADGESPLVMQMNQSLLDQIFGNQSELYMRVFADDIQETEPPMDICLPPNPVREICAGGLGATVNQKFTMYTTVFYGYVPSPDWTYIDTQSIPPPPSPA